MRVFEQFRIHPIGPIQKYGLEVELEGCTVAAPDGWRVVADGSLRGGCEFISEEPKTLETSHKMLDRLSKTISEAKKSPRTSFHIHVDASTWTMEELMNVIRCYITTEDIFFGLSGNRRGSQFCVPVYESTLMRIIRHMLAHRFVKVSFPGFDTLKYGALNVGHLLDFGSLEFRHHTGLTSSGQGKRWLSIVSTFCLNAKGIDRDSLFRLVQNEPKELLERLFPGVEVEEDHLSLLLHFKATEV